MGKASHNFPFHCLLRVGTVGNATHTLPSISVLCYPESQPFYQRYKSILPTSLTYIVLINQRLITLETCCGIWYGLMTDRSTIVIYPLNWIFSGIDESASQHFKCPVLKTLI